MKYSTIFGVACFVICSLVGVQSEAQFRRGPNKPAQEDQPQVSVVDETEMEEVSPEELDAAYAELEQTHAQHYQVLQELRKSVPESSHPAIDKAMQASEQGWRRAREARQRVGARLRKVLDGIKSDTSGKGLRGKDGKLAPVETGAAIPGDGIFPGLGNQQGRGDQGNRSQQRVLPNLGLPKSGGPLEKIGQGNSKGRGPRR